MSSSLRAPYAILELEIDCDGRLLALRGSRQQRLRRLWRCEGRCSSQILSDFNDFQLFLYISIAIFL